MAQKYIVKKGDNPLVLSQKFGIPPSALLKGSGLKALTTGQTIRIPDGGRRGRGGPSTPPVVNNTPTTGDRASRRVPTGYVPPQKNNIFTNLINILTDNVPTDPRTSQMAGVAGSLAGIPLQGLSEQQMYWLGSVPKPANYGGGKPMPSLMPATGRPPPRGVAGAGMVQANPFANYQTQPASSPFANYQLNQPLQPQANNPLTVGLNVSNLYSSTQQVASSGTGNSYKDARQVQPTNGVIAAASPSQPPSGSYTGSNSASDQAWRNYWNEQVRNPVDTPPPPPKVMSRGEIWEMKANQRRRRIESADFVAPAPVQVIETPSGNSINSAANWRVG